MGLLVCSADSEEVAGVFRNAQGLAKRTRRHEEFFVSTPLPLNIPIAYDMIA